MLFHILFDILKTGNDICTGCHDVKELNICLGKEMDRSCVMKKSCKLME